MTSSIEFLGVFVCGALFGAAIAIQVLEMYGMLRTHAAAAPEEVAVSAAETVREDDPCPAKKPKRRTPWRKVKARYEAKHRRRRQSVEQRVREMEEQ